MSATALRWYFNSASLPENGELAVVVGPYRDRE
jgi:hypothetical protein